MKKQNMLECEVKYSIESLEQAEVLLARVKDAGFLFTGEEREVDFVPDALNFPLRKNGLLLRFRAVYTKQTEDILLTLKIKKSREKYKVDEEIQCFFSENNLSVLKSINEYIARAGAPILSEQIFGIRDFHKLKALIVGVGFTELRALIGKKRLSYKKEGETITFDQFPEEMGCFMEIESPNVSMLQKTIDLLGLDEEKFIVDDYGEIIKSKKISMPDREQRTCLHRLAKLKRYILFETGPVNTLLQSKNNICIPYRHEGFQSLYKSIRLILTDHLTSFAYWYDTILLPASGTSANETFFSSLRESNIAVLVQGRFGEKLAQMAETYGHKTFRVGTIEELQKVIMAGKIQWVAAVHHETSIGYVNDLKEIGEMCRNNNALFFVDGISSVGIEDVDLYFQKVDVLSGVSGKAFASQAGVSFLIMNKKYSFDKSLWKKRNSSLSLSQIFPYHEVNMCLHTPIPNLFHQFFETLDYLFYHQPKFTRKREEQMKTILHAFSQIGLLPVTEGVHQARANATFILNNNEKLRSALMSNTEKSGIFLYTPAMPDSIQVSIYGSMPDKHINNLCKIILQTFPYAGQTAKNVL